MKKNTRFLVLLTMIYMLIVSVVSASAIESFKDYNPNHWANVAISHAIENNVMNGYEDNTIRPDRNISRAEMAAMLNRAFGAVVLNKEKSFDDVSKDAWYYEEVAKAVQMQTFGGTSETTFEPERPILREEAMVAIARAMVLEPGDTSVLTKFGDFEDVSPWAKESVAALVECGCVNGTDKNLIEPRRTVTRAQFAQMLYNIFEKYISKPGTYSIDTNRSLMINAPDVELENCTINGDLVLGDGVHDGFVKTYNVKVKGRILIRGGNKVTFTTTTTDKNVVVKALNGTVNFQNYRSNRIFKNVKEYTKTTYLRNTSSKNDTKNVYFTVEYYIPDGTGGYTKHSDRKVSASSGTAVDAKDYVITIDGYKFDETITTDRTGTVSSDNSLIVKAYYKKLLTVRFYRWDDGVANWVVVETVSDLNAGDTVSTLPVYSDEKRGYQTGNNRTHVSANSLYSTNFVHKISSKWAYDNGEKIAEFTSDTEVYQDLDVYPYFKRLSAEAFIKKYEDKHNGKIEFEVFYDDSRFIDSLKDAIWVNKGSITTALDMINIDGKLIEKLNEHKLTDTEGKIYNQEQRVRLADLFGDDLDKFVRDSAKENVTKENTVDFLDDFLSNADNEVTATELIQGLIHNASGDEIENTFKPAIKGFLEKDDTLLEEQIREYVNGLSNDEIFDLLKEDTAFVRSYLKNNTSIIISYVQGDSSQIKTFLKTATGKSLLSTFIQEDGALQNNLKTHIIDNKASFKTEIIDHVADISNLATLKNKLYEDAVYNGYVIDSIMSKLDTLANSNDLDELNEIIDKFDSDPAHDIISTQMYFDSRNDILTEVRKSSNKSIVIGEITSKLEPNTAEGLSERRKVAETIYDTPALFNSAVNEAIGNASFLSTAIDIALGNPTYVDNAIANVLTDPDLLERAVNTAVNNNQFMTEILATTAVDNAITSIISSRDDNVDGDDFDEALDSAIDTMLTAENKGSTINTIMDELFAVGNGDLLDEAVASVVKKLQSNGVLRTDVINMVVDYIFNPTNPASDKKEELVNLVVDELYADTIDQFVKELREKEQFTVYNEFTHLIAKAMYDKFYGMSLEDFLDTVSLPDGFDKVLQADVINRVLNDIYNDALNPYLAQIQTVRDSYSADPTGTYYIDTYVTVRIDPIDDLVNPFYDKFREILDEKVGDVRPYRDNPYVVAMVDLMAPKYLLPALEGSYDDVIYSGYRLPTIDEAYTILYTLVVLADDAAKWYLDNYDTDKVDVIIDKLENTVIEYANCILSFINEYKEHGTIPSLDDLPDSKLTELCEKYGIQDIIDRNEKIQAIIEKITANEKFNNVIDKFYNSSYNDPVTSERYQKIATKVKNFFDLVFDNYQDETFNLDEFFRETILDRVSEYRVDTTDKYITDMYKITKGDNYVTVTREFEDE